MTNPGSHPFKAAETVGAFVERIGGIKPTVYDSSEQPVLKQLEALAMPEIDLPKQSFTAALGALQQRYANGKGGGVINFIVRGSATDQPAAPESNPAEKIVSLQAKNLNIAAAIDALCVQAGCEWWLESNDEGVPLLVIRSRGKVTAP